MSEALPFVSCLAPTWGRHRFLCDLVAYFDAQDYPADRRELLILNNHPTPLACDVSGVRIINAPGHPTLGDCWKTLLVAARGEVSTRWGDDDRYLPWHISLGVEGLLRSGAPAWKPKRSWLIAAGGGKIGYRLSDASPYISAAMILTDFHRSVGEQPSSGDDDVALIKALAWGPKKWAVEEVGWKSSYLYFWNGIQHASAVLQSKKPLAERDAEWKRRNSDDGGGKPVVKADLGEKFRELVLHCNDAPSASWSGAPWAAPHPFLTPSDRASLATALKPYIEA